MRRPSHLQKGALLQVPIVAFSFLIRYFNLVFCIFPYPNSYSTHVLPVGALKTYSFFKCKPPSQINNEKKKFKCKNTHQNRCGSLWPLHLQRRRPSAAAPFICSYSDVCFCVYYCKFHYSSLHPSLFSLEGDIFCGKAAYLTKLEKQTSY